MEVTRVHQMMDTLQSCQLRQPLFTQSLSFLQVLALAQLMHSATSIIREKARSGLSERRVRLGDDISGAATPLPSSTVLYWVAASLHGVRPSPSRLMSSRRAFEQHRGHAGADALPLPDVSDV